MKKIFIISLIVTMLLVSSVQAIFWVSSLHQGELYNFNDDGSLNFYIKEIGNPVAIAQDPTSGNVAILVSSDQDLIFLSSTGSLINRVGPYRAYNPALSWPSDAVYDNEGNLWIADEGDSAVVKLNAQGHVLFRIKGNNCIAFPHVIEYSSVDNALWVAGTEEVVKIAVTGEIVLRIPNFDHPQALDINKKDGSIVIADTGNTLVKVYSSTGQLIGTMTQGIRSPRDVAFDADNNVWVVNTLDRRIMKFDRYGFYLNQDLINIEIGFPKKIFVDLKTNDMFILDKEDLWRINQQGNIELYLTFDQPINDFELALGTASSFQLQSIPSLDLGKNQQQDMRSTSAAVQRRDISAPIVASSKPTAEMPVSAPAEIPVAEASQETDVEVQQLRQQVAEQRETLNDLMVQKTTTTDAGETKSSELISVLVVTFLILLVLAFLGGMMLRKRKSN